MEIKTTMQIHKGYNDLWEDIEKVKSIDILKSALGKKWVAVDGILKYIKEHLFILDVGEKGKIYNMALRDLRKELSEVKDDTHN